MNETLGVSLLVAVVVLILKALWDLKTAPTRNQLEQRLDKIEDDVRFVRDRILERRARHRSDDETYGG